MWRVRKVAVLTLLLIYYYKSRKSQRRRRYGVRPFNKLRALYGQYETMVQYIKRNDEREFFSYTRMSPQLFDHLVQLVAPKLTKHPHRKNALSPSFRVCLTLHYLAEGCSMKEMSRNYYIGKASAHMVIREVCTALWDVLQEIYLPEPTNLILMAVCDANYKFIYVDIAAPGSFHDSYVFRESNFGRALLSNQLEHQWPAPKQLPNSRSVLPHFLVADQAFPLHTRIMHPYPGQRLGVNKNIFNYRLSRARRTIENTFGILAQRWRILRKPIIGDIPMCTKVVQAVVVLHNYVKVAENDVPVLHRRYCPTGMVDDEQDGEVTPGTWRKDAFHLSSVGRIDANITPRPVQQNRVTLCEYFVSDVGAVHWQWNHVLRGGAP
ncbi:hypothetical protein RN001_001492 [Aquatica leii]|uniref:DDE Tnp4 domain-containing protein n=1 Tax=Aquatica leii TaxID=1421715 RepID=A0AAN7PL99_9COLE|nr:hypothetical protein RN001_001492 [Aquatica leii]